MRLMNVIFEVMKIINRCYFGFLAINLLAASSCHSPAANTNKKVFIYNESDGIATLDPAGAKNRSIMWAIHQLYNTLVETDDQLNIVPSLAKSWDISPD